MIDVGQGDSCLIITPQNQKMLVDGGGTENYEIGENVLKPFLLEEGITEINYIIISHFDSDHAKGILEILDDFKIENIIIPTQFSESENYNKFKEISKKENFKTIVVEKGKRIKIEENIYIDVLWPDSKNVINENGINNNSIVCKMIKGNFSILFTGDIEEPAEEKIVELYENKNTLKSTILKIAHHGSKSSSTQYFLDLVKPKIALIGVGENNKFGHPNQGVLERLKEMNVKIYRTDIDGQIVVTVRDGTIVNIETWMMLNKVDKFQTKIGRKKLEFRVEYS